MTFQIWVAGWSKPRQVTLEDGELTFEVARISCSDCQTCRGRLQFVRGQLGSEAREVRRGGGVLFALPYPASEAKNPEAIAAYIAKRIWLATQVA